MLITEGKLPSYLFMIYKTTTCVTINPLFETALSIGKMKGKDWVLLKRSQDCSQISFIS